MDSGLIIGILLGGIIGFLLARIFGISSTIKDRQISIRQSKASILGHVKEQMAPISPGFPYYTKDMVFIGKGFDYLVLDGLSAGKLQQIVFLEIKSGGSSQNRNEKQIENAIDAKIVKYEIIRL